MNGTASALPTELDRDFIDAVVGRQDGRPGALLGILQQVQNHHPRKFLPKQTLEYIGARTGIPLSRIYSVVTFYALFNLEPQGLDTICVCRGTACHTRGSRDLLEKLMMHSGSRPRGWRDRQDFAHDTGRQHHAAHRRLLRPMRAGAGRRGQSRGLRPHERADAAARTGCHGAREPKT